VTHAVPFSYIFYSPVTRHPSPITHHCIRVAI
jgi:hypothetical protein